MRRLLLKLCLAVFRRLDLTLEERNLCTGAILDKLEALPLHDIITSRDGEVLINGKSANLDMLRALRESAIAAIDNRALNYIAEQVVWVAVQRGVHQALKPEDMYFYRAAIWVMEQLKAHLRTLAQQVETPL